MSKTKPVYLSASRLKTVKMCSWLYWCKYHERLPDKSNDGASRGTVCHLIFECLGKPSRQHYYDAILESNDPFVVPSIKKLILSTAQELGVDDEENMDLIKDMIAAGVRYDFFGKKNGKPTPSFSVEEGEKDYYVKGFIDKLFIYDKKSSALIRDFKTSKQVFKGEDKKKNLQDYIYSLAVKYLFPDIKNRNSEFVFLKFDLEKEDKPKGLMKMRKISDKKLDEFEIVIVPLVLMPQINQTLRMGALEGLLPVEEQDIEANLRRMVPLCGIAPISFLLIITVFLTVRIN